MVRGLGLALVLLGLTQSVRAEEKMTTPKTEKIILAGGCFWCIEAVYERIPGVVGAVSGYLGGHVDNPTYRQVCEGTTGHAEAVEIEFDPAKITLDQILDTFWHAHDPTQLNRQGNDVGTQYRSAIFYFNEDQKKVVEESIRKLIAAKTYAKPIVTQVAPAGKFYVAEDYHQAYFENNKTQSYCRFVIQPKLEKLGLEK